MTPGVEKFEDKVYILWTMAQIFHVADPQCLRDILFLHSDEQWYILNIRILEDGLRVQKWDKKTYFPEI